TRLGALAVALRYRPGRSYGGIGLLRSERNRWLNELSLLLSRHDQAAMHYGPLVNKGRGMFVLPAATVFVPLTYPLRLLPRRISKRQQQLLGIRLLDSFFRSPRFQGVHYQASQEPIPNLSAGRRLVEQVNRDDLLADGHGQPGCAFDVFQPVTVFGKSVFV